MDSNHISRYESEATEDLKFTENEIHTYSLKLGAIKKKWISYLFSEKVILSEMEGKLNQLYKKIFHELKTKSEFIIEKKDIELYIRGDKKYSEAKMYFSMQEYKIDFIEHMLKTLDNQSFLINNALKYILYRDGN